MHIVISAFSARRGGGKTYLKNLLKYCPRDVNYRVTLLISSTSSLSINHPQIIIKRIQFPVDNPFTRFLWELIALPIFLRKEKTDVFFCPGGVVPRTAHGSWKIVTMFRNMIPFDIQQRKQYPIGYMRVRNWMLSKSLLRSMENADLVIFISEYARKVIQNVSQKGVKKNIVIPHGVSLNFDKSNTEIYHNFNFKKPYILYPSIIDVYKSQKEVIEAYAILRDRKIDLPQILMVGEIYGRYGMDVTKLIKQLNLELIIKLTGSIPYEQMPSVYKNALFVVFASKTENCPNILLESMSAGRAILCSNYMPMPEFGGDAVEYFDPCNPTDLADRIENMLRNLEYVENFELRAKNRITNYSWDLSANKTWQALAV